jgi:hypothetical protein
MADIYQQIWDADQEGNGIRAITSAQKEEKADPEHGYVIVDSAVNTGPEHRLLKEVIIPNRKMETYELCKRLFNNYTLDQTKSELNTPEEDAEVFELLRTIINSKPMKVARQYVSEQTGEVYDELRWSKVLMDIWFHRYKEVNNLDLSGFEHVIVGEQKEGTVSGYHFWYKYYLDDGAGLVGSQDDIIYAGTRFDGPKKTDGPLSDQGILVPEVATIAYRWNALDYLTGEKRPLYKPIGGFWIGCSIEGLLALGAVRFIRAARAPKEAVINGARYDLRLHRSPDNRSLRTFFPEFLGLAEPGTSPIPEKDSDSPSTQPIPEFAAAIRILAALVNPVGNDEGSETVILINPSPQTVNLSGWSLEDKNRGRYTIQNQSIAASSTITINLPKNAVQLSNKGSIITLLNEKGQRVHGVSYTAQQANREGWTLVF